MDKFSNNTKNNPENNTANNPKNNPENNLEKISLTFSKDKEQWSINKPEALVEKSKKKNSEPGTKKSASKTKITCKVSIPLSRVPNCWKILDIKMTHKMPPLIRIDRLRPSPAPIQPIRPPLVSTPNATKLSNYRHPVPTNTCRTIMADKLDKGITETRTQNIEIKPITPARMPYRREVNFDSAKHKLPVSTAPANIRTKISNHLSKSDTTLTISTATASIQTETTFMIEEEDLKLLQVIKSKNVSEDDLHILEVIKNSGINKEDMLRQIEKIKKRNESSNDIVIDVEKHFENTRENNLALVKLIRQSEHNKYVLVRRFIELVRLAAASRRPLPQPCTSTLETVTPHEISPMQSAQTNATPDTHASAVTRDQTITTSEARTPTALETLSEMACAEKRRDVTGTTPVRIENSSQTTIIGNELLRGPIAKIPTEDSSASASLAPTAIKETYLNNGPSNDLLSQTAKTLTAFQAPSPANSFARAYPERIENIMAFRISQARPNTDGTLNSNSNIYTRDNSNSRKRKATPDHHMDNITTRYEPINLPQPQLIVHELRQNEAVVQQPQQQQQELSMFQQIPVHVRQPQMRYAGPGRQDRSELHLVRVRKLQQQRAQYQQMRIQFEQNRPTMNAPHIAPQQPQMPPPIQLYPCEQIRSGPSQMPIIAPARRVFSTEEANIHGQVVQRGRNWHYPVFYDRNGNCWPRPHDFSQ